jgi:hypothetical protein
MPILQQFEADNVKNNGYVEQNVFEFTIELRKWLKQNDYTLVKKEKTVRAVHNKINNLFNFG